MSIKLTWTTSQHAIHPVTLATNPLEVQRMMGRECEPLTLHTATTTPTFDVNVSYIFKKKQRFKIIKINNNDKIMQQMNFLDCYILISYGFIPYNHACMICFLTVVLSNWSWELIKIFLIQYKFPVISTATPKSLYHLRWVFSECFSYFAPFIYHGFIESMHVYIHVSSREMIWSEMRINGPPFWSTKSCDILVLNAELLIYDQDIRSRLKVIHGLTVSALQVYLAMCMMGRPGWRSWTICNKHIMGFAKTLHHFVCFIFSHQ